MRAWYPAVVLTTWKYMEIRLLGLCWVPAPLVALAGVPRLGESLGKVGGGPDGQPRDELGCGLLVGSLGTIRGRSPALASEVWGAAPKPSPAPIRVSSGGIAVR